MKNRVRRLAALVLCLFMLLPRQAHAAGQVYPPLSHEPIGEEVFEDLKMDPSELTDVTEKIDAVLAGPEEDKEKLLPALYEELLDVYDHLETQYVLIEYAYAKNVNDVILRDFEEEATSQIYDVLDTAVLSVQKILEDPAGDFLTGELSEDLLDEIREYTPLTKTQKARKERISALVNDYRSAMSEELTVSYNGREWSKDDLNEDVFMDYEVRRDLYFEILKKENEIAGPIYKDLVALYIEDAQEEGYDSYVEYAYEEVHGRDYSAEDLEEFYEAVKEEIVGLDEDFSYAVYDETPDTRMFDNAKQEEILDAIEPWIGKVSPELSEAYTYMRENGLADIAEDPNREDGAFTSSLPEYHAAVMLVNAYGSYWDHKTLVHEFGHFNAAYHNPVRALYNSLSTDVAEVQSQGLEVLFLPYWSRIAGNSETGRYFTLQVLEDMLYSVVMGCMYNECEVYAFTHPDESLEEWNRAFGQIYAEYGYEYLTENGSAQEWVEIGHLFEAPLYYISYATSAIAALTIWSEAEEDRDAAVKQYLEVSACTNETFLEMLEKCGLPDVFEEETIDRVSGHLSRILDGESSWEAEEELPPEEDDSSEPEEEEEPFVNDDPAELIEEPYDRRAAGVGAAVLGGCFVLRWIAIAVMLLVVSGRRKKRLARMGLDRNGHRRLQ